MPIVEEPFDREKHIYRDPSLFTLLRKAVRFFNGTPVHKLPFVEPFEGAGVYALYYIGTRGVYKPYGTIINAESYEEPIYVGKADLPGKRQSRSVGRAVGNKLYNRLLDHSRSIGSAVNLSLKDFACRFVICEGDTAAMIPAFEDALTRKFNPLWNSFLDGFGNHAQGSGRSASQRTQWDTIHPGRSFAEDLQPNPLSEKDLKKRIADFFVNRTRPYLQHEHI